MSWLLLFDRSTPLRAQRPRRLSSTRLPTAPGEQRYPTVCAAWRNAWDRAIPFFAFPSAVRKVIYTTNAIENVNAQLRKIINIRGHFPTDEAATKLIWPALRNIPAGWSRAAHDWKPAMNQFAILYTDQFVRSSV